MFSRRDFLKAAGQTGAVLGVAPFFSSLMTSASAAPSGVTAAGTSPLGSAPLQGALRCINVVNFIREIEPRFEMDMMLPVREQMKLILEHKLPATWLLQFDALVSGPFVEYLRTHMAPDHEVGLWFEMNERHCKLADVEWRGRLNYEWDHIPSVAFTIGYTEVERVKLADTAMRHFKAVWGKYPKSLASWNLDSFTLSHLTSTYGMDAYSVCRDQIATDGFTIWGAPIAGYYPSKVNCWSPAIARANQIDTPVFRMLGQDPVYYYQREYPLSNGQKASAPDTMEPAWPAGQSPQFVDEFLRMIAQEPTLRLAYAQLGQENTFPWPQQSGAYPMQMQALAALRDKGTVRVETMGESGRRFKRAFATTPAQAQVQMRDPFGHTDPAQRSAWYQSRFYRANLHFVGNDFFLRDLTVYSDRHPQPFLKDATRLHDVEQRMPAIVDGYHWSKRPNSPTEPGAGGYFYAGEQRLTLTDAPQISEAGSTLTADLPVTGGRTLHLRFEETQLSCTLTPPTNTPLALAFEWDTTKAILTGVTLQRATYRYQGFDYGVDITEGTASATPNGWTVTGDKSGVMFKMVQN